ncbi:BON domain-containing protein [Aliikangiella sp. IMCC44359]|uniref:BON domain-containing protein n=1 Tax=Aliikangiella sp. IMCC44359 TaxID=3459125 RepID=UPI00403AF166
MSRLFLVIILLSSFLISGCSGLIVAGAATGAVASQDRRPVSTQIEDEKTEISSFASLFKNDELWEDTNISVISYNNVVLMVGQAPTSALKEKATEEIKKVAKSKKILNQIRIAAPISFFASRNDEYLTTKVKSSMLFTSDFKSSKIKVVTENSEVFLMGLVTQQESEKAVDIARNVDGVTKVIKAFEFISD